MEKGKIFEIKRFSVHDGDGIRTTVFFKGCSLKCAWCHNPESFTFSSELAFFQEKCAHCGTCVAVCPQNAHTIQDGKHVFSREKCTACGACISVCPNAALQLFGKEVTVDELLSELLEDKAFYDTTNGGVTLSGGECLLQADFCAELLKRLKENGVHTAVDTCGFVPRTEIDKILPYTDVFLYDMKAYDENVHIRCTGKSNAVILDNLRYISKRGVAIEIRIPFVPTYNDKEIESIGNFLREVEGIRKVKVLPYHNLAASKYTALGKRNDLPQTIPTETQLEYARNVLRAYGLTVE
ncbi:MAG: glycyl-radical enzyme activating protein [Clostridiales bacterium]|nr:glycyl-radical enzyme activating protein [Clostridiales bacterium]